jgi:hypothetical protein
MIAVNERLNNLLSQYRRQQITLPDALTAALEAVRHVDDQLDYIDLLKGFLESITEQSPLRHARSVPKELRDAATTGRTAKEASTFLREHGFNVSPRTIQGWPKTINNRRGVRQ